MVPLTSLDVIDGSGSEITDNKLLSLALAKISKSDFNTGQVVRSSSDLINEYS